MNLYEQNFFDYRTRNLLSLTCLNLAANLTSQNYLKLELDFLSSFISISFLEKLILYHFRTLKSNSETNVDSFLGTSEEIFKTSHFGSFYLSCPDGIEIDSLLRLPITRRFVQVEIESSYYKNFSLPLELYSDGCLVILYHRSLNGKIKHIYYHNLFLKKEIQELELIQCLNPWLINEDVGWRTIVNERKLFSSIFEFNFCLANYLNRWKPEIKSNDIEKLLIEKPDVCYLLQKYQLSGEIKLPITYVFIEENLRHLEEEKKINFLLEKFFLVVERKEEVTPAHLLRWLSSKPVCLFSQVILSNLDCNIVNSSVLFYLEVWLAWIILGQEDPLIKTTWQKEREKCHRLYLEEQAGEITTFPFEMKDMYLFPSKPPYLPRHMTNLISTGFGLIRS